MQGSSSEDRTTKHSVRVIGEPPTAIGYHVTMRLSDDRGIARSATQLRHAARIFHRHGESRGLVAFRIADTHAHALVVGPREEAGRFALFVEAALRKELRIPVAFERCRIRPIDNERHLANTLRYTLKQEAHHGTAFDLAHDGSSLVDLLGMRLTAPWLLERVRQLLPRLKRAVILEWLEAPELDTAEPDLRRLADAAAAAWSLRDLRGSTNAHYHARRAAVHVCDRFAHDTSQASSVLQTPQRSVVRYRNETVPAAALRAVERQLRLRSLLQRREAALFEGSSAGG